MEEIRLYRSGENFSGKARIKQLTDAGIIPPDV